METIISDLGLGKKRQKDRRQVNVASFESRLEHAAFSGTPVFRLQASVEIPAQEEVSSLKQQLETVCEQLNLSYLLEPEQSE